MKNRTKIEQKSIVEALKLKKGASEAKNCVLEVNNFDFRAQDGDFRVPRARLWRPRCPREFFMLSFELRRRNVRSL